MARLRLVFALLAVAILGATALLAARALRASEVERAARHQTLAERLFDEMERSLSAFLRREEERPVGHYDFSYAEGAARLRSPLSRLAADPQAPFVVGWFQVEPDGRVHSPLVPRPEDPPSGPPPDGAARETAARVLRIVEGALASPEAGALAEKDAGAKLRAAPAEVAKREGAPAEVAKREAAQAPAAEPPAATAYDAALQSLNRGSLERQGRERKVLAADAFRDAPAGRAAPAPAAVLEEGARFDAPAPAARLAAPAESEARRQRIAVDPFVGRLSGEHLLLVRTVWVGDRGHRQGLVLHVPSLARWLREQALGGLSLPGARLAFEPGGSFEAGPTGADAYRFGHRFGEPFDALSAELGLAPLPDLPGERAVLLLAGLLVLAAGAGLFGLYRMVAVRLAFAQRRSNFAAAVSHELKTPLTAIRMYVEMLRDGLVPSEEKRREYYATLGTESERLSRLIDNVLEFSRLERGTRQLELRAAALGPVVEELAALLRPHAERQGFRLEVEVEPGLPPVRFERDALAQILFNLVENALKYGASAGARGGAVRVACRTEAGRVALSVRDHGPGVPERQLRKVFEPFYRGEDELTRETQGSGIGLALVRGLAERMGAAVAARNAAGGGFEVTLRFRSGDGVR